MARSSLFRMIKRSLLCADSANLQRGISRRDFLTGASVFLGAASGANAIERMVQGVVPKRGGTSSKIVIVGGGLAGLVTAYRLQKAGVPSVIYEASARLGGRIYTKEKFNSEGMYCELGGELIDSEQREMIELCAELNLPLQDFTQTDRGLVTLFYGEGKVRSEKELISAFRPLAKAMREDLKHFIVSKEIQTPTYKKPLGPKVIAIDRTPLSEYLSSKQDRVESWVLNLVKKAYVSEYGLDAEQQSAINLLILFDPPTDNSFLMYGSSDECKRVEGGNGRLAEALSLKLSLQQPPELEHQLIKIEDKNSALLLTFLAAGKTKQVRADRVVLALPFSVLREVEGVHSLSLSPAKKKCLAEMVYGTNTKLMLGYIKRFWREKVGDLPASRGSVYGDFDSLCFWETSRMQKGNAGILTTLLGGKDGLNPPSNLRERTFGDLAKIYPHAAAQFDGNEAVMTWPKMPWAKGSYSSPGVGHYTSIVGAAEEAELGGRLLFTGEHCSVTYQGYMNGAIESANRVALGIVTGERRRVKEG